MSAAIALRLSRLAEYRESGAVMFFSTHGSEVITGPMIQRALRDSKKAALPRVSGKPGVMHAACVRFPEKDLVKGTYGILEPRTETCPALKPASIDMVVVPGIVFDRDGHRLGYGKGYYDRWLKAFDVRKRIGVCFDFQVVNRLPKNESDVPVGMVITEKQTFRPRAWSPNRHVRGTKSSRSKPGATSRN